MIGYYAVLPDGTEVPKVSAGEKPLSRAVALAMVRRRGGGSIRAVKRRAAR